MPLAVAGSASSHASAALRHRAAVATSVAVFRVRRARETQHSPNATCAVSSDHQRLRLAFRPDALRSDSEDRENAALSGERATGVEPATSSLGIRLTKDRKTMIRGHNHGIGHELGCLRVSTGFTDVGCFSLLNRHHYRHQRSGGARKLRWARRGRGKRGGFASSTTCALGRT